MMENLIIKYLTDSISNEELSLLKDWLKSSENQDTFKSIVQANKELDSIYKKGADSLIAYKNIEKAINREKVIRFKSPYKTFLKYAAIAIILLTVYFGSQSLLTSNSIENNLITLETNDGVKYLLEKNNLSEIKNKEGLIIARIENGKLVYNNLSLHEPSGQHQLTVPNGKIFSVVLSDGTTVLINSGSSLKYSNVFSTKKTREVFLNGEAYFDVTKNKNLPFIVHTDDMNIKVLGTKFNVSSYDNDTNPSVFLEEGSVGLTKVTEIFDPEKSLIIKPNQRAVLEKEKFVVYDVSDEKYISWKKRQLTFKNDRFEDVIKKLERFYDVSIKIDSDKLKNNRYTGKFSSESISEVLDVFKELSYFNYIIEGNTVSITGLKN